MKLAFVLDPLPTLKHYKDSSVAMMRAAAARGHEVFAFEQRAMAMSASGVVAHATPLTCRDGADWYAAFDPRAMRLADFDAVLMRKDPPVDTDYLLATYLLDAAEREGARVLNRPRALRDFNEKLAIFRFSEFIAPTLVTAQADAIRAFLAEHGAIVVKPLTEMGGAGVYKLTPQDPNLGVILESSTRFDTRAVMAQRWLPEISAGDKRILLIDGEPIPYALARIPKPGETRGNLAAGGTGVAHELSARDADIARAVGAIAREHGLFLIGLDVIGEHLTEVNVTSPTGFQEIAAQTGFDVAGRFVEAIESSK
jgi:glutathione synthase